MPTATPSEIQRANCDDAGGEQRTASGEHRQDTAPVRAAAAADRDRRARIVAALDAAALDAFVCTLPRNVLLLSGYWPVVGTACAVAGRHGTVLIVPEDEYALAVRAARCAILAFQPSSLARLTSAVEALRDPLRMALRRVGVRHGPVGVESGSGFEPWPYVGMHAYGPHVASVLRRDAKLPTRRADHVLQQLASTLTPQEIDHVRKACRVAGRAFARGMPEVHAGCTEREAASRVWLRLAADDTASDAARADGFVFCMSGPNAARAFGAFARSTSRLLTPGDLVLVHCNSFVDGYWTDITRTYCLAPVPARVSSMYDAVFAAREAALAAVHPGARAADVDAAARRVLDERGFGSAFKHATGHGVGFAAIDHNAPPRLHPQSGDILSVGAVFNIEPGIYLDGYGGLRHCDVVVVTEHGVEVLTTFHDTRAALTLAPVGAVTEVS